MLNVKIDKTSHVAVLEPDGPLSESDFRTASAKIDALIEESGNLKGLVVHAKSFPGWDSIAALIAHLRFIKDHHKKLARVALATESVAAHVAEVFAGHFVMAEIRIFSYADIAKATRWVTAEPGDHHAPATP